MTARTPRPVRVLVVDDDPQVVQAVRWALEDEGIAVVTAGDGHEAVAVASEQPLDLVVLDLTLPSTDGYEVASTLRSTQSGPLPILLVTADGHAPSKAELVGAYAFLRKPFQIEDLLEVVRRGLDSER